MCVPCVLSCGRTIEEITRIVGADSVGYLSVEHVQQLAQNSHCGFCTGCFTGHYPVPEPTETMDDTFNQPLSLSKKNKSL